MCQFKKYKTFPILRTYQTQISNKIPQSSKYQETSTIKGSKSPTNPNSFPSYNCTRKHLDYQQELVSQRTQRTGWWWWWNEQRIELCVPACFFSVVVPLRWRISSSTRPKDIRPRVNPDIIPANKTRKQEIPAYINHQIDPNSISAPNPLSRVIIRAISTAFSKSIFFFSVPPFFLILDPRPLKLPVYSVN